MNPSELRALLERHGVRTSKALGQHFLADANTARRILRYAGVAPGDDVVEVGPGVGALTVALADAGARVLALELDRHLVPVLESVVGGRDVEIVLGDALDVEWSSLLARSSRWAMISNLPYNVATPLVVRVLEAAPMVDRMLVMVQREVGERLAAPVGTKQYGAVTVKVAYYAEAHVVGIVPPTVFVPRPNVESALVKLVRRAAPVRVDDPARMFDLVRAGFATRRKTLRNALAPALGERATVALDAAGIDPGRRAETLTLDDWAALAEAAR
ncbi:MAG: 16S rRNA (adenine(1518)-N(6)/adenine(1519)-N(6))-dimethyltransferase RsmA [Acidimicrobiia bacterium]